MALYPEPGDLVCLPKNRTHERKYLPYDIFTLTSVTRTGKLSLARYLTEQEAQLSQPDWQRFSLTECHLRATHSYGKTGGLLMPSVITLENNTPTLTTLTIVRLTLHDGLSRLEFASACGFEQAFLNNFKKPPLAPVKTVQFKNETIFEEDDTWSDFGWRPEETSTVTSRTCTTTASNHHSMALLFGCGAEHTIDREQERRQNPGHGKYHLE